MTLGMVAGLWVTLSLAKRYGIAEDEVYNLGFYTIIFSLVGARLFSVFLDWSFYLQHPEQIIAVWNGGLAIHGAIIGGAATFLVYAYRQQQSFWRWADLTVPGLALGQAFGRWGNYFNQEIFGRPTDLPWGIPIELANRPVQYLTAAHFHPTFLYESILNVINFLILYTLHKKFKIQNSKFKIGIIFAVYLVNYSIIRAAMEMLRTDPVPIMLGLRTTLWWTLIALVIGVVVLVLRLNKKRTSSIL